VRQRIVNPQSLVAEAILSMLRLLSFVTIVCALRSISLDRLDPVRRPTTPSHSLEAADNP